MVNLAHLKAQMQKVREATLGEVILFTGQDMFHSHVFPSDNAVFKAGLSVYSGISINQYLGSENERVENSLKPSHNLELAIIEYEGVYCPLVRPAIVTNQMTLGPKDNAYVGPEEISDVLRTQGKGLFDKLFQDYLEKHRRI